MILVHVAESHYHEIVTSAEQKFHVYQGADHLIFCNKSIFEPERVKIQEEIQGTSNHDSASQGKGAGGRPNLGTACTQPSLRI